MCICPLPIVVSDLSGVDGMGPVEELVEVVSLRVCDGIDCYGGIRGVLYKLSSNPFQGAAADMVISPQEAVVPLAEMVILLVEDL